MGDRFYVGYEAGDWVDGTDYEAVIKEMQGWGIEPLYVLDKDGELLWKAETDEQA